MNHCKINNPILSRKVKRVEYAQVGSSLLSPHLANTTSLDSDGFNESVQFLKDKATDRFEKRFKFLRESRGNLLISLVDSKASTPGSMRPYNKSIITVLVALYAESALFTADDEHNRLIDDLDSTKLVYDPISGTSECIRTEDCFTIKGSASQTINKAYDKISSYLRPSGQFLQPAHIQEIEDFINTIQQYESLDPDVYTTNSAIRLSLLASHIKQILNFFPETASTKRRSSSVVNATSVELPEFLDFTTSLPFLTDLITYEKQDAMFDHLSKNFTVKFSSIIEQNEKSGFIELNPQIADCFYSMLITSLNEVFLPLEAFVRHVRTRTSLIPKLLLLKLFKTAAGTYSMTEDDRKLMRCFLDVTEVSFSGSSQKKLSLTQKPEDVDREFQDLCSRVQDVESAYCDAINKYYTTDIRRYLAGFTITHSYINRHDLIYRLERVRTNRDPESSLVLKFKTGTKGRKVINLDVLNAHVSTLKLYANEIKRNDYLGLEKIGVNSKGRACVSVAYGCAVINCDLAALRYVVGNNASYLDVDYDEPSTSMSAFTEVNLYTIDPPAIGEDHISFGVNSRKENNSMVFTARHIDSDNADIIDLLMSYPSSMIIGIADSSDKLAELFDSRIKQLSEEVDEPKEVQYSEIVKLHILEHSYDLFAAVQGNEALREVNNAFDVCVLPSGCSITEMENKKFPALVKLTRFPTWKFFLPYQMLNSRIQNTITAAGWAHGIQLASRDYTWEIRPLKPINGNHYQYTPTKDEEEIIKKLSSRLDATELVMVKIAIDTRYDMKAASGNVPKNPRSLKFSAIDPKTTVLRYLDYGLVDINNAVKDSNIVFISDSKAVKLSESFGRKPRIQNFDGRIGEEKSVVEVANACIFNMILDALTACSNVWGSIFDSKSINLDVLYHELCDYADYLSDNYDSSMPLLLIGISSTKTVGDLTELIRKITVKIWSKAKLDELFDDLLNVFAIVTPMASSLMYLYQLRSPMSVDECDRGYINDILSGNLNVVALPKAVANTVYPFWDQIFVGDIGTKINELVVRWVNDSAVSGQI